MILAIMHVSMIIVTIQAVLPGMCALKWGRRISLSSVAAQVDGVVGPHCAASRWSAQFLKSTTVVDNPVSFVVSTLRNT